MEDAFRAGCPQWVERGRSLTQVSSSPRTRGPRAREREPALGSRVRGNDEEREMGLFGSNAPVEDVDVVGRVAWKGGRPGGPSVDRARVLGRPLQQRGVARG